MFLKITGDMFRYKNLPTTSIVINICIPLINLLVSMVFLDSTDEEATNYEFNKTRSSFRCYPRFNAMGVEFVMTHMWTVISSIMIVRMIVGSIRKILDVTKSAQSSAMSKKDKTTIKVIQKLVCLGTLALILLTITLGATHYYVPLMADFAFDSSEWYIASSPAWF